VDSQSKEERMKSRAARFALGAIALFAAVLGSQAAQAQTYPTRPIQVIVGFAAGSASDVVLRVLLERMSKSLGQPFVVENRPGAGGNIGMSAAAKAAPDGYTLVMGSLGPLAANRTLYRELGYDPDKDFEPISLFAEFPNLIVINSKLPINSLADLIAYAKARPKQLNYGSVGVGSSQHLSGLYFEQITGVELTHVPYRNIAQYIPDLIAGAVPLGFQWLPNVNAALKTGDAKPLAVTVSKRMTAMPHVPTTAEAGVKNYETSGWLTLMAPRGTAKPIVARLNQEVTAALKEPAVRDRFVEQGGEPLGSTPEEVAKFITSEAAKWREIIQKGGIQPIQ
jgi:tripartite-type tricarboxylate transporter receptor subunit TctC